FDPVTNIVSVGDKHFRTEISAGDTTLVSMYGFHLLYGNPKQAFRNNQSAVVTEDFALKFFSEKDVLNKVITIQTPADGMKHDFIITAVLKNTSRNTVTNFTGPAYQVYLPMDANQYFQGGDKGDNWANVYMASMLQLKKGATPKDLEKPFAQTLEKYQPPFVKGNLKVELAPVKDYYLRENNGSIEKMITILSLIAVFILIMAIINFVNINIGTSSYRLKEIGLRKVFGSAKIQLIVQFITEALLLTLIATIISALFYELLRPVFNQLLNTALTSFFHFNFARALFLSLLVICIGLISGIYPAFVLSSTGIANSVKGKLDAVKGSLVLRKTLLVIQFTLAIVVFISAVNVAQQINYVFHKDLGYNRDQVMIISSLPRQWDSLGVLKMKDTRMQLQQINSVKNVSLSYDIPDGNGGGNVNVYPQSSSSFTSMRLFAVDDEFSKVYNVAMKEGVFLNYENSNEKTGKVVLNETATEALGWNSAVGKTIKLGDPNGPELTIVGVVKDFHYEAMQHTVQPLIMADLNETFTRAYRYLSVKLNTANVDNTINALQEKCKVLFPDAGFEYSFMDDKFQSLYKSELQLKRAAGIATGLNLIIVFLGIVGVVAFTLTKRVKEIAVRKVLGAGIKNIILLFIKEYAWLIIIANIIAWPLAYMVMNHWLQNFAYRIQQGIAPFIFVGAFIFLVAFSLIAAQCFKAANANPVKSLRTE
ncbi:MAG: ABC transporter permease, partial [Chitinophagales bacterium]